MPNLGERPRNQTVLYPLNLSHLFVYICVYIFINIYFCVFMFSFTKQFK